MQHFLTACEWVDRNSLAISYCISSVGAAFFFYHQFYLTTTAKK
jgi:hypothetical protein